MVLRFLEKFLNFMPKMVPGTIGSMAADPDPIHSLDNFLAGCYTTSMLKTESAEFSEKIAENAIVGTEFALSLSLSLS